MASEEMFFFAVFIFSFFFWLPRFWLPWQPIQFNCLNKIQMFGKGLIKEYFSETFDKISAMRSKEDLLSLFALYVYGNFKLP